jgi:phosphopantetheinyl transferase
MLGTASVVPVATEGFSPGDPAASISHMQSVAEMATSAISTWETGPAHPSLDGGVVDIWLADLPNVDEDLLACLSEDEVKRARGIVDPRKGARWARSRAVLKDLLGRYTELDASRLNMCTEPSGKLRLARPRPSCERPAPCLQFNLSHSGALALCAFSRDSSVGIDVERFGRRIDHVAIARRVLGVNASLMLRGLSPVDREREFLRLWVRWEAALKRDASTRVSSARLRVPPLSRTPPGWVSELEPRAGWHAAVAAASRPDRVRFWTWKR